MSTQNTLLPAASGYSQLMSALTSPVYAKGFLKRFNAQTVSGLITDQSIIPKEIVDTGDEVIFRRAPEAEIFTYQKNQELQVSGLSLSTVSMSVKRGAYSNLKVDKQDTKAIKDFKSLLSEYQKSVTEKVAKKVDKEMLFELPRLSHPCNRGPKAGRRSHSFNFGTKGAPVTLTRHNILEYLAFLRVVLDEQDIDTSNLYIVLPTEAQGLLYTNGTLMDAAKSGMAQSIILGTKIPNVMGFTIYFSNQMPQFNENGSIAYTILAGRKDATGFAMNVIDNTHIPVAEKHLGQYWRMVCVYDFKPLYPEALATLYAKFDFSV